MPRRIDTPIFPSVLWISQSIKGSSKAGSSITTEDRHCETGCTFDVRHYSRNLGSLTRIVRVDVAM